MFQIGICDDKSEMRMQLRVLLERLLERQNTAFQTFEFSSAEGLLSWQQKHRGELDLILLDISMGGMNGMEAARLLRKEDTSIQIVFVTGYSDYVFDGYEVGALGYLLKPPSAGQLEKILLRAQNAVNRSKPELFFCRNGESYYRIPKDHILYFRSQGRKVTCFTPERNYTFYERLSNVANELGADFIRIHQRYLVRAGAVTRINNEEVALGDVHLPVSRTYSKEALLALAKSAFS